MHLWFEFEFIFSSTIFIDFLVGDQFESSITPFNRSFFSVWTCTCSCVCVFQRIWGGELVLLVVWPLWSLWWSMAIGGSPLNKTVSSKWDTCVTGRAITNWQNDRYRRVTFCTTADLNSICWGTWRFSFVLVTRGTLVITAMRIWLGVPKGSPWFATLFTLRVWPFLGIAFKHASSSAVNKGVWKKHAVNKTCHDRQVLFKKGSFFLYKCKYVTEKICTHHPWVSDSKPTCRERKTVKRETAETSCILH